VVEPIQTCSGVPDRVPAVPYGTTRVPDRKTGQNGLKPLETLGSVPKVPEVPDIRDANGELTL